MLLAGVACLRWSGVWPRAALVLSVVLFAAAFREAWLRYCAAEESVGVPAVELLHPITTLDLRRVHFEQELPNLPVEHLRVLHLTDLHITEAFPSDYYVGVEREIAASNPDLLLMTGDYLSETKRFPLFERWLAGLPRARYGNFAVLGNHEYWLDVPRVRADLERAGVTVLSGKCTVVAIPNSSGIRLCGTDAPWGPAVTARTIAEGAPGTSPLIAMAHTPDNAERMQELGASVLFAGHTHGGQMRLPFIGAPILPLHHVRYDVGHFNVRGMHLWVSSGVGADEPPLRIYCPPELVEVDFRR